MAAQTTPNGKPKKASNRKPRRLGKVRYGKTGRGWQAKLYGPTDRYPKFRVSFKDSSTMKWVDRQVPKGRDPDEFFDEVESDLDNQVVQHSFISGDRPTMRDLADRYIAYLRSKNRDGVHIRNVKNLLDVWVLSTDAELDVQNWSSEHTVGWIERLRAAGRSAGRVESLGTALSGMRRTAHRKGMDGTRWLNPAENPMEGVEYSRSSTERGTHRDYVPPSHRPTIHHLRSLVAEAKVDGRWTWMPTQMSVGGCCGPRLSEQMGLRAVDIDFVTRELRVWMSVRWPVPSEGIPFGLDLTKLHG